MNARVSFLGVIGLALIAGVFACDAGNTGKTFGGKPKAPPDPTGGPGGGATVDVDNLDDWNPGHDGTQGGTTCATGPGMDYDADGFTFEDDCNDCDANVNPHAVEVPSDPMDPEIEPADENCDGATDEPLNPCDGALTIADVDPMSGAKAINLCHVQATDGFGVVSANYVRGSGAVMAPGMQSGLIDTFGPNVPPRHGARMLGLSSGRARPAGMGDSCNGISCSSNFGGTAPTGFPQQVPGCSGGTNINDDIGLEVQLQAPSNANGFTYEFDFYSFEFPEYVCTTFNDQYIALVTPPPTGSILGNVSFDSMSNPVSVNIAFFEVCTYNSFYPQFPCALGPTELQGTGFDTWGDAGATSWLVTTAPIEPGSTFSIRFQIWDTGDSGWDSTVLIDNFQWIASAGTVMVATTPVPE